MGIPISQNGSRQNGSDSTEHYYMYYVKTYLADMLHKVDHARNFLVGKDILLL